MCFSEYKQCVYYKVALCFNTDRCKHDQMSSKTYFLFQSKSFIDRALNLLIKYKNLSLALYGC